MSVYIPQPSPIDEVFRLSLSERLLGVSVAPQTIRSGPGADKEFYTFRSGYFTMDVVAGRSYTFTSEAYYEPWVSLYDQDGYLLTDARGPLGKAEVSFTARESAKVYITASARTSALFKNADLRVREDVDGVASTLVLTELRDSRAGTEWADKVTMLGGNDWVAGRGGDDVMDGGPGIDTAAYLGHSINYTVTRFSDRIVVQHQQGKDGTDTLTNVERLKFDDKSLAFDLAGNAGKVAKIIGAVFGKAKLADKNFIEVGLQYADSGTSYEDLAALALQVRLGSGLNSESVVKTLYTNVTGVQPTAAEVAHFKGMLDSGMTVGQIGVMAADTQQNAVQIDLIGLSAHGLAHTYTPPA